MLRVAVTGEVASGKTTVCQIFSRLGAFTANADVIVHQILEKEGALSPIVEKAFNQGFSQENPFQQKELIVDRKIDREKLAEIVFQDPSKRRALENWLHPLVLEALKEKFVEAEHKKIRLFIAEIPLLYEAGFESYFDKTIVVLAPLEMRMKRSSLEKEMFLRRSHAQMSPEEKLRRSDYVIYNDGIYTQLEEQVQNLYMQLLSSFEN